MSRDKPAPADAPGIHVAQVRFITDGALPTTQAQAIGTAFAAEVDAHVQALRPGGASLRIGELVVQAPAGALDDPATLRQLARTAAERILDRVAE